MNCPHQPELFIRAGIALFYTDSWGTQTETEPA